MTVHFKKIIILFSVLVLITVGCGKPDRNDNHINSAQQNSNQNNQHMNQ